MTAEEKWEIWVREVAATLEVPLEAVNLDALLDLTRDVAYGVERPAAPLSLFLAGYALAAGKRGDLPNILAEITATIPPLKREV